MLVNVCLLAMQVFSALRAGQLHIPYRNSKLTHILQPSLGGDAKVRSIYYLFLNCLQNSFTERYHSGICSSRPVTFPS